ncbi:uncharacterized protein LOC133370789 [Rhineura floridana]|uniref:uncharacterized protein LOC133370789 n=1 Tax=Rhineura floridana TaxID=261503 RepID=UPI002AC854E8|nr:uncharacterized protein LOC133370789 [Rhineura floridana]XP_061453595.1 uncharacterized protein LOC133370789 [Rhineura floridana]XP_061453596.1 uncharacterized protein LOC133370789 [Rhineura floridana]
MAVPNHYQILPVQGFLLLWAVLHFSTWTSCALADSEPISGAALSSNSSMNRTDMMPLTCQHFQCSGKRCYQDEAHGNSTEACHNASHCELYRLNSTSYTARCSSECGSPNSTEPCLVNGSSVGTSLCTMDCCSSPNCLRLNASAYGDQLLTTTLAPTTTITTTKAPPRNGKVCSSFTCHGEGCYKGQKASVSCIVGFDFCEMKKTGSHFVAGCSNVCKMASPACSTGSTAPCYQECCPAVPKTSCLKLDGKVHFNRAGRVAALGPLLLACAAALCLNLSALFSSPWPRPNGWGSAVGLVP